MSDWIAEQHLAQAERAVTLGRSNIERQTRVVADLERAGQDATQARELLAVLRETLARQEAHRDRLLSDARR